MTSEMEAAVSAAINAGRLLKENYRQRLEINEKSPANMVTNLDLRSERMIVQSLSSLFPDIPILAEESGKGSEKKSAGQWIIDPLDGTTNYIHGYPFFAVSIALEREGRIILGVVFAPMLDQLFTAEAGQGAFLNHEKIFVSRTPALNKALVGSGFPYYAWENDDNNSLQCTRMIKKVVSLRSDGSAALDLCMVASGILDGYWELDLEPWDTAAGALIAAEAGGKVTLANGNPFSPYQRSVLASNSLIHEEMMDVINY